MHASQSTSSSLGSSRWTLHKRVPRKCRKNKSPRTLCQKFSAVACMPLEHRLHRSSNAKKNSISRSIRASTSWRKICKCSRHRSACKGVVVTSIAADRTRKSIVSKRLNTLKRWCRWIEHYVSYVALRESPRVALEIHPQVRRRRRKRKRESTRRAQRDTRVDQGHAAAVTLTKWKKTWSIDCQRPLITPS